MNRSPQTLEDGGGWGSRATLTQYPAAKTVYFYKDGDKNFNALKLAVHPRKYRSFSALLTELSNRIPLSFGVRSIYTPRGNDNVGTLGDLSHEGRYVCSTHPHHAKGIDLNGLGAPPAWHFTRPPSGRRELNTILSPRERDRRNRIRARRRLEVQRIRPADPSYQSNVIHGPKKVTVLRNGEPTDRHIVLLNRRTAQTFEQVLSDLSDMFKIAARKIYTIDGRRIQSLSSVFNGPDVLVVAGGENFRPMVGFSPQPPMAARPRPFGYRNRLVNNPERSVAHRLRDRRERLGRTRGRWRVWVTTNELPSAGTDASVTLTVYGTRSDSGPIPLSGTDDKEYYQSGAIDQFDINVGNIGEVYKIRIAHDNVGEFPNWLCDQVKMRDLDTEEELVFPCKRWLARDEDDGEICREIPAARKGEPTLPVVKYDVMVTTGELWNAGTKGNVYLTMYGERGDTGIRHLTTDRKETLFLSGQTNTFHMEAVSLGPIKKVIVGHDVSQPGEGWYLERIVVRDPTKSHAEFTFFCGKWLDTGEDDGKIVRELRAQDEYMVDLLEKKYWEYEKWKFGNRNQVVLYSCQTGKPVRIKADSNVDANAEPSDQAVVFNVISKRGMVRVFSNALRPNFHLAIDNGRVLGQGKGGAYCEFRVRVQHDRSVQLESVKYPLQHVTIAENGKPGDVRGLTVNVSKQFRVYCKGMFRDTGILLLMTSPTQAISVDHDNNVNGMGKKSRVSQFRVHKVSEAVRMFESVVSPGQFLQLKQGSIDCQGDTQINSHFIIEKHKDSGYVSLQSLAVRGLYVGMANDGTIRPTVNTGDKNVWLFPEVVQFGIPKVREEEEVEKSPSPALVVHRSPTPQRRDPSPDVVVVEQKQASARKATPPPKQPEPNPSPQPEEKPQSAKSNKSVYEAGDWKATVSTQETGQNGEIALVAYGDKGSSGQIILGSPQDNKLFQKGNMDEFKVNLLSVGVIYKIRLEFLPTQINTDAFWKVKDVKLQDMNTKELLKFPFNRWLSLQQDDGDLMRELPALRPGQEELPVIRYQVLVSTGKEAGSDTDAHVYLMLIGERGDSGKRLLHRSNKDAIFKRDQVDEFWLEAVSLGKLKYCQVSHDGSGPGEGWYCDKVVVREGPNATMETVFPCEQWLDSSMGDKKIERILSAKEESEILEEQSTIEEQGVLILEEQSSVEEQGVLILEEQPTVEEQGVLILEEQPTVEEQGVLILEEQPTVEEQGVETVNNDEEPETGEPAEQPDTPDVDNEPVVEDHPITTLEEVEEVEEQNEEHPESPVENNETDLEERPVVVETVVEQTQEEANKAGDWKIWVTTGKDDKLRTSNDIILVAYGDKGVSEPITLGNRIEGIFQPASTDEFKVNLGTSLGSLYKIRIGHKDMSPENGWFLEKVKMQDLMSSEVLSFKAGRWLSRGQDDLDTWRELPVVRPGQETLPVVIYNVEVYTGAETGADTDANVYVTLYGSRGDSGQRVLYHSQNENKFHSGQMDEFKIEAVSLDDVKRIVIGHDGKGAGAGWFLEKVVVKETVENQTSEYYFPCHRWFDEGQDDGLIEREILVQSPPAESRGEYRLYIKTHPDSKPANGSKVYLTAYGEKGRSKDVEVCSTGENGRAFEPGNADEFEILFGDLGDLYKIRVTREDNCNWEAWHLKEVKLVDKSTEKEYLFAVDRWLARTKEDFDVTRELPVVVDNKPVLPICHYEVQVYTGNRWAASTESSAYITLFGKKGDSGKRRLFHSTVNQDMLKQNQMDKYLVEAVSLDDLTHIVIGHDGKGHGSGWFLEKVVVMEKEGERSNLQQVFPCGRWLDDHEGDGKTERTLRLIDSVDSSKAAPVKDANTKTQGKWKVKVKTSDLHNAGTHAQVYMTIYGSKGTSKPQPLGNGSPDSDIFDQGKESEFDIDVGDIGDMFKLRLEHDNKNNFPAWHVDYIKLTDVDTQEEITVYIDRWLAVDEEDGQLCREFPLSSTNEMPLPVLHYVVVVYTGSQKEAGTDTTIFFNLFGNHGDIGHRPLMDSRTNPEPYQPGQVDVFVVEAVSVGRVEKLELFHNGKTRGQSWFVDKVVVLESEAALTESVFQCSDWLEVKEGETMAMKQFKLTESEPASHSVRGPLNQPSSGHWSVWVTTGAQQDAGTKDDVFMKVYGTLGNTDAKLINEETALTPGAVSEFKINTGVIGRIFKVQLCFGGKEKDPSWFLKKLKMKDDDTGQEFHFDFNDWLKAGLDNPTGVTELPAIRPDIAPLQETKYVVSVVTGSQHCADTQADVFCNLIGQWGETGRRPLATPRKSTDPFKKGQVDEFGITSLELGQLEKVVIGHSKSGRGQGWFCERVTVKTLTSPTEQVFVCNRWLDSGCHDRKLTAELFPLATVPIQAETDDSSRRERSKGVWSSLVTMTTQSKLSQHTVDSKQPVDVSLVVCGDKATTETFHLSKIRPLFIGQMEEYKGLQFGDIGKIEKVRVALGSEMDLETLWTLEEIILEDEETKETLRFDFSTFTGKVFFNNVMELPAVRPTETVKPVISYHVKVHTSSDKDASTTSPVFITLYGQDGTSGRRLLGVNQDNSTKFQVSQVDEFEIKAVSLGQLEKVVISKGPGDPWHLDKVVVKEGSFAGSEAIFSYNSWVGSSDQTSEEVSVTINVSGSETGTVAVPKDHVPELPDSKGSWSVQTVTGKDHKKAAGINAILVFCGDQGESTPVPLSTTKKDFFAPGKTDDFKIKVTEDVGDLFKIRVGFAERTKDKTWKIEKMTLIDDDTSDQFSYEINDWLRVDKVHDGWLEFPVIWPAVPVLPVLKYNIAVHFGDVRKIPPTANLTICMEGQKGMSGIRQLKKPQNNNNRFQKDQVDVYEIEAVTLLAIQKVTLAHNSKAPGAGFFLKKVVIKESAGSENEYEFLCDKWLDAGEDDKVIERVLTLGVAPIMPQQQAEVKTEVKPDDPEVKPDDPEVKPDDPEVKPDDPEVKQEQPNPATDCQVTVTTSGDADSGTTANVILTVVGEKGNSGSLPLKNENSGGKSPFAPGKSENFEVHAKLKDIGEIKKIRLEHDNSGSSPGWKVEKIVLESSEHLEKPLEFIVGKHLSYDDGYGDVVVEIPVNQGKDNSVKQYYVEVDSGESMGAGTDANVYITLYGEKGDSGKRQLKKSLEKQDMFESGKLDTFIIEAVDLGKMSRVVIGHDNTGQGAGWKLDNVMVRDGENATEKVIFHCGQWLDAEQGDKKTEREIFPLDINADDDDDDDV